MLKKNLKIFVIALFSMISLFGFSVESEFLAIGNVKIVRPEPLVIKREDLNLTIEKNGEIKVESLYTFENIGKYDIKSTFMFWIDQNVLYNPENKSTNIKGKYIKNVKFFSNYEKSKNSRAVINFDEKIYESQTIGNIQRDWYAISKTIPSDERGQLGVYYNLINTNFENKKELVFSFDLVNNFYNKNFVEILYVNIYNKSDNEIESISYKNYEFNDVTGKNKKHYELLAGNVNLDGKMIIKFK